MCSDITDLINMFSSNNQYHLSNIHEGLGIVQKTFAYIISLDLFNNPGKQAQLPEFPTQGWGSEEKGPTLIKSKRERSLGLKPGFYPTWKSVCACMCVYACAPTCTCAQICAHVLRPEENLWFHSSAVLL